MKSPLAIRRQCPSLAELMQRISITLFQYAGFLLVVGLASAFYNAATREAGWNAHGATGLYACGGSAVVVGLMAWLTGKGMEGAAWVGLALAFLLVSYGSWTLFKLLRDVDGNAQEVLIKRAAEQLTIEDARRVVLYKAGIFGAMVIFSLSALLRLATPLRRSKTA
jgi:hypothetical protein